MTRGTPREIPHPGLTGSPLIRLLARLAEVDAPDSRQAFAERLSQWLGWTDAISLSAALKASPSGPRPAPRPGGTAVAGSPHERECQRVRAGLLDALADEPAARPTSTRHGRPAALPDVPTDFASYRRRYFSRQQAMDAAIAALRAQLRTTLSQRSPELARLAAVDAVMEQALGERERTLLSIVPVLLEKRFERLRRATAENEAEAEAGEARSSAAAPAWLDTFRQDMHSVALAELELRWHPIDGLLDALRHAPAPTVGMTASNP